MQLPNGLRAFRHHDYRLFFGGQVISLIGTWMQTVGQSWLVVTLTDSAFLLGLISTLQFLPQLLFALFAGALADRLPKRKALVGTQTAMMLVAFIMAALVYSGHVVYWHVAVLAALHGFANTLDIPVRQSFIVEMVGKEDLGNAIGLNSAMFNSGRLIGPAVAGILIGKYGVALAFFLNGLSFVPVIFALLGMRAQGLPKPRPRKNLLGEIADGLRYVYRTPKVFFLITMLLGIGLFVINWTVLVTVLANSVLNIGADGFGYLMSALGAGAMTGGLILAFRKRTGNLTPLVTAGLTLCTVCALMFFARDFWIAAIGLYILGLSQILYTADTNTNVQLTVPDELRGRVMSIYQLVFAGSTPIGSLITGAVIERTNGSTGFLVDGLLGLLSALVLLLWWRGAHRKQEGSLPRLT